MKNLIEIIIIIQIDLFYQNEVSVYFQKNKQSF